MLVLLVLIVVPIAELYVFVQAAGRWGFVNALGLIVLVSIIGVAVVRLQGLKVWSRFQQQVAAGEVPSREIADGVALLVAGLMLIIPGFLTDAIGVLLLLPPVRSGLRALIVRRAKRGWMPGRIINVTHRKDEPPTQGQLGP